MADSSGFKIIAVDGGAATGKSSTSRAIAERLKLMHVDTGAHYRTLTYALLKAGANADSPDAIPALLKSIALDTAIQGRSALLSINSHVPADTEIRSAEVNSNVSKFAAIESVREFLFNYQRSQVNVARAHPQFSGLIMEGRDIGSVIFPNAEFRFFLFADEATRATRRAKDGQTDSIADRDKRDSQRKTAPLVCPEGANRIDTGSLTLEGVVDHICDIIAKAES
jgi:cytidylate kinase